MKFVRQTEKQMLRQTIFDFKTGIITKMLRQTIFDFKTGIITKIRRRKNRLN